MTTRRRAPVEYWNGSTVKVRCPSCGGSHSHGFTGYEPNSQSRLSHCADQRLQCQIRIHYPFGEAGDESFANYEIDKQRGVFVAAGVDISQHFPNAEEVNALVSECKKEANSRPNWTDSTATTVVSEYGVLNTIQYVFLRMIQGDFEYVRQYLDTSAEAVLFLRGVETTSWTGMVTGETVLHFASCEMFPDIVELLLERGADPNVRDAEGRTSLSEAALWGRLENVKLLLNYGANPLLACIRDGKRALAVEFAKNDEVNTQKRSDNHLYKEDVHERNLDRRAIVNLLEPFSGTEETLKPLAKNLAGFNFTRAMTPGNFLSLVALFDVPNQWKPVGVLWRGSSFPPVAAMSGWAHQEDPVANLRIAREEYTDAAWELCSYIGHDLAPHYYDQARPGQFHACHAEKQLIAYFVSRHVFLHHETSEGWAESVMGEYGSGDWVEAPVPPVVKSKLSDHQPPVSLRKATVMVSSPQCLDCQLFVARLNEVLGLQITVVAGGVV